MKNRYFYLKIFAAVALVAIIVLWVLLFFLPTNRYVYNANKEIKEMKRKIAKYRREKVRFQHANIFEDRSLRDIDQRFRNRFYTVSSKEDMIRLFRKVYDHIQYYEQRAGDQINELQITTEEERKTPQSAYMKAAERKQKMENPLYQVIPGLNAKTVNLSFNGKIQDSLNFINHITWSHQFIDIKELEITKNYKMTIRIYYIDTQGAGNR